MKGEVIALAPKPSFQPFQLLITLECESDIHKLMSLFQLHRSEENRELTELLRKELRRQRWN